MSPDSDIAVLAQGGLDHLRELRTFLEARGVQSAIVQPPGYTGKG